MTTTASPQLDAPIFLPAEHLKTMRSVHQVFKHEDPEWVRSAFRYLSSCLARHEFWYLTFTNSKDVLTVIGQHGLGFTVGARHCQGFEFLMSLHDRPLISLWQGQLLIDPEIKTWGRAVVLLMAWRSTLRDYSKPGKAPNVPGLRTATDLQADVHNTLAAALDLLDFTTADDAILNDLCDYRPKVITLDALDALVSQRLGCRWVDAVDFLNYMGLAGEALAAGGLDTQRVIDRAHECIPRVYRDWTA